MFAYLLRRLAALVPVMLIVATVGFVIVRLAPGDPAVVMLGPDASPDRVAELRRDLGLQEPVPVQLLRWYQRVLRADFGRSVFEGDPVTQVIRNRLEPTVLLTLLAMVVAMAIGVPAGVASAVRRNSLVDQLLMGVALL
ncbi:MAG: ABC transporter permease, partial [Armatimonadota bacterium]|nr:ABC transporter permease [Armatimonadota bacterium]